jgi:large subunit ribosomal protein L17
MYKRNSIKKLGRTVSHRKSLTSNQLTTLFTTGKLKTTSVKAKVMKRAADELISSSIKIADLVSWHRNIGRTLRSLNAREALIHYAKETTSPSISIVKIGFRKGDNAEVSEVTLKGFVAKKKETKVSKKKAVKVEKNETVETKSTAKTDTGIKNITKKISQSFVGRQERARTRSGI